MLNKKSVLAATVALPVALAFVATSSKSLAQAADMPPCESYGVERIYRGLYIEGFERSEFNEMARLPAGKLDRPTGNRIWLFPSEGFGRKIENLWRAVPGYPADVHVEAGQRMTWIEFRGVKTTKAGRCGHLGGYGHEIKLRTTLKVRPLCFIHRDKQWGPACDQF